LSFICVAVMLYAAGHFACRRPPDCGWLSQCYVFNWSFNWSLSGFRSMRASWMLGQRRLKNCSPLHRLPIMSKAGGPDLRKYGTYKQLAAVCRRGLEISGLPALLAFICFHDHFIINQSIIYQIITSLRSLPSPAVCIILKNLSVLQLWLTIFFFPLPLWIITIRYMEKKVSSALFNLCRLIFPSNHFGPRQSNWTATERFLEFWEDLINSWILF